MKEETPSNQVQTHSPSRGSSYQCRCEWWARGQGAQEEDLNDFEAGLAFRWRGNYRVARNLLAFVCSGSFPSYFLLIPLLLWDYLRRGNDQSFQAGRLLREAAAAERVWGPARAKWHITSQGSSGAFADSRGTSYFQRTGIRWAYVTKSLKKDQREEASLEREDRVLGQS